MHLCSYYARRTHNMLEKETRQEKMVALLKARRIATQGEIARYLRRHGIEATQSSVSRDLEELGVIKRRGFYTLPKLNGAPRPLGLVSLEPAGDVLIVARCEAGLASGVAVAIDRASIPEIAGTLAGEDTVFVAIREAKDVRHAIRKITRLFF